MSVRCEEENFYTGIVGFNTWMYVTIMLTGIVAVINIHINICMPTMDHMVWEVLLLLPTVSEWFG